MSEPTGAPEPMAIEPMVIEPVDEDASLQAEHATHYMADVWLPEGRCYVLRRMGGGENVLRYGDLIEDILEGRIWPPAGPVWMSAARRAQLSAEDIEQLLARGVTGVLVIPETVCRLSETDHAPLMLAEAVVDEMHRRMMKDLTARIA